MKEQQYTKEESMALSRRIYPHRTLGMGLAFLPVFFVFSQNDAPTTYWIWAILVCLVWPHVAFIKAKASNNAYKSERQNLAIDSFIAGTMAPLMYFNILPSVMLVAITLADKFSTGVKHMTGIGALFVTLGMITAGIFTGFEISLASSTGVILATLPIIIVHTMVVSFTSYKLIREVHFKNQNLNELNRTDPLTKLYNCGAWQEEAKQAFSDAQINKQVLNLMIIDIDNFKSVNDQYGHSIGDQLIVKISKIIQAAGGENSIAGRLGGDEFGLIIQAGSEKTKVLCQKIITHVQAINLADTNSREFSVSIGFSCSLQNFDKYLDWFNSADKALYKAKNSGRNTFEQA